MRLAALLRELASSSGSRSLARDRCRRRFALEALEPRQLLARFEPGPAGYVMLVEADGNFKRDSDSLPAGGTSSKSLIVFGDDSAGPGDRPSDSMILYQYSGPATGGQPGANAISFGFSASASAYSVNTARARYAKAEGGSGPGNPGERASFQIVAEGNEKAGDPVEVTVVGSWSISFQGESRGAIGLVEVDYFGTSGDTTLFRKEYSANNPPPHGTQMQQVSFRATIGETILLGIQVIAQADNSEGADTTYATGGVTLGLKILPKDSNPSNPSNPDSPSNPTAGSTSYRVQPGVMVPAAVAVKVETIADQFRDGTGKTLTVVDGARTPAEVAAQILDLIKKGGIAKTKSAYKNNALIQKVVAAYNKRATDPVNLAAMTAVIESQVAKGQYVTDQLRGRSVDISTNGLKAKEINTLAKLARKQKGTPRIEVGAQLGKRLRVTFR